MGQATNLELATLGGGCFWCLEAAFKEIRGVHSVESGYAGGHMANPSYEEVCEGTTGHAEVVQIAFDPGVVSYHDLLMVFFGLHDPTSRNRQGADIGTQYRSVIFAHSLEQAKVAHEVIEELNPEDLYANPIVTEVKPFGRFYPAEGYHQGYFAQNPEQPYCQAVVAPKLRKQFYDKLAQ